MIKVHPNVRQVLDQIVDNMTRIYQLQKTYPVVNPQSEPESTKLIKRTCVHLLKDENNEYRMALMRDGDDYVCEACGRKVNIKFDKAAVDKIVDAIEVIDGLAVFGIANGLMADPLKTIISVKAALPGIATLQGQFNEFVKKGESTMAANGGMNFAKDYHTPERYTSITGYHS